MQTQLNTREWLYYRPGFFSAQDLAYFHRDLSYLSVDPAPVFTANAGTGLNLQDRQTEQLDLPAEMREQISRRLSLLRREFEAFFGVHISGCEAPAVLRYGPGGFFRTHRDWRPELDSEPELAGMRPRQISVIVFLSRQVEQVCGPHEYSGGELVLYPSVPEAPAQLFEVPLRTQPGALVAFRSDLLHEVRPVLSGERMTLVAWLY